MLGFKRKSSDMTHSNKKQSDEFERKESTIKKYSCNCEKSNCSKKYCICFLNKEECDDSCSCKECCNGKTFESEFKKTLAVFKIELDCELLDSIVKTILSNNKNKDSPASDKKTKPNLSNYSNANTNLINQFVTPNSKRNEERFFQTSGTQTCNTNTNTSPISKSRNYNDVAPNKLLFMKSPKKNASNIQSHDENRKLSTNSNSNKRKSSQNSNSEFNNPMIRDTNLLNFDFNFNDFDHRIDESNELSFYLSKEKDKDKKFN